MNENIHIATLGTKSKDSAKKGGDPKAPVIAGVQLYGNCSKLYLVGSDRGAFNEVREIYKPIGRPEIAPLVRIDAYDFNDIMKNIIRIFREETSKNKELLFFVNVTGGTKVMTAGALVAAHYIGATPYYIKKDNVKVEMPIPKIPPRSLSEEQTSILKLLAKAEQRYIFLSQSNIAERVTRTKSGRVSPQKVSYHCTVLENAGYIRREPNDKDKRAHEIHLTEMGSMSLHFL